VIHSLRGIEGAAHAQLLGAPTLSSLRAERDKARGPRNVNTDTTMSIDSGVHSMSYSGESPEVSRFATANACGETLP
jgi:hypothetical protein